MSATDEFRRMLSIREVEWMPSAWSAKDETFYKVGDVGYLATELSNGKMKVCIEGYPTPAQAIAATLGDVPRLPYFWTADGTLHIELPRLPESISVRLPDQRDREVGSARTWQYTLGVVDTEACQADTDGLDCGHVRNSSAKLEAENAKLIVKLNAEHIVRQNAEAENAKLRELVHDYEHCTMHADCSKCEYDGKLSTHCPLSPCFPDADELSELGIEVPL